MQRCISGAYDCLCMHCECFVILVFMEFNLAVDLVSIYGTSKMQKKIASSNSNYLDCICISSLCTVSLIVFKTVIHNDEHRAKIEFPLFLFIQFFIYFTK